VAVERGERKGKHPCRAALGRGEREEGKAPVSGGSGERRERQTEEGDNGVDE
jgi:hypothetical protein